MSEQVMNPKKVLLRVQVTDGEDDLTVIELDITKTGFSPWDERTVNSLTNLEVEICRAIHNAREMVRKGGQYP